MDVAHFRRYRSQSACSGRGYPARPEIKKAPCMPAIPSETYRRIFSVQLRFHIEALLDMYSLVIPVVTFIQALQIYFVEPLPSSAPSTTQLNPS